MWFAVYRKVDQQLVSFGTVLADPMPDHLASCPIDGEPDYSTHDWSPADLAFIPRVING